MRRCREQFMGLHPVVSFVAVAVLGGSQLLGQVAVKESTLADSALSIAPIDVAFFSTSLNLKASWQQFMSSNFVKELRQVPYVQKIEERIQQEMDSPDGQAAPLKKALENPNIKNLVTLAQDMFTDEVFFIGGHEWCEFGDGFADLQNEITEAMADGEEGIKQFILDLDNEAIADIPVPTTIIGFKLPSDANARLQLDALEGILRLAGASNEQLEPLLAGLKRSDLRDGQILSFSVDTDSIPWDVIPLDGLNDEQHEIVDKVIEVLKDRQVTLSVGVIQNRLMIALSESADVLKELKEGEKLLSHDRLGKLLARPPKNLRNVAYVSADWRDAGYRMNFDQYFRRLATQMTMSLKQELDDNAQSEAWLSRIMDDADWLDDKLAEMKSEFDAQLSYSFATEDGVEGLAYDWSENQFVTNAKPLTVIRHAGQLPLLLFAVKQKWPAQIADICQAIVDKAPSHLKHLIESGLLDEDEDKKANQVLSKVWPLITEGYEILRDKIMPSLDEHESLISISAQWTTTSLGEDSPQIDQPLPLPEIGGACKLKNKDLFLSGCDDLLQLMDKIVVLVREIEPDAIPATYHVPHPEEEELPGATRYFYEIPGEQIPFEGLQLQLVVSDDSLVYGYSTRQVRDMVAAKPLSTRPAWLAGDSPAAAVAYIDFAGVCAAIKPWIRFGLMSTSGDLEEPLPVQGDFPTPTGNDILQIWDCFHNLGKTAGTTVIDEDGTSVSRWVWVGK